MPSAIKIGKEQFKLLAYADNIVINWENGIEIRTLCRNGKHCQKVCTTGKPRKDKIYGSGKEKQFKEK